MDPRPRSPRGNRIGPVDPGHLRADQQRVFDRIAGTRGRVAGPFTALLHVPQLADRVQELGAYLRYEASLPRHMAEVGVLVTAQVWRSDFEWTAHEPLARAAGVPDEVIATIASGGEATDLPAPYAAIVEYVRQLGTSGQVSDTAYEALLTEAGPHGLIEMTVLVGYYALLAMTLSAHQLEMGSER